MAAVVDPPHADVFTSPALPLLLDLERLGCTVELTARGTVAVEPASRLTPEQRAKFLAHARDLALLVRLRDDGVAERCAVFRQQLARAPGGRVPCFLFRVGVPYVEGVCFSCGDPLETFRIGRCQRCALAWRLACRVPMHADLAAALDGAAVQ